MTEPRFKVGDPVTVSEGRYRGNYEATITRIGRKYAYIERWGREIGFDLFTGYEANNKYGAPSRIRTAEMVAEDERRYNVTLALKEHGITYERWISQSTDVLEKILRVIEETA